MDIKDFLISYFSTENYEPIRAKELADRFGLVGEDRIDLYDLIDEMLLAEQIKMTKRGRIKAAASGKSGKRAHRKGAEDLSSEDDPEEEGEKDPAKEKKEQELLEKMSQEKVEKEDRKEDFHSEKMEGEKDEQDKPAEKPDEKPAGKSQEEPNPQKEDPEQEKPVSSAEKKEEAEEKEASAKKVRENEGQLKGNAKGFAFFISDDKDCKDVYIAPEDLHGALNGDRVRIRITRKENAERGFKQEGEVIKILQRDTHNLVGTFRKQKGFGFVVPDEKEYFKDIYVEEANSMGAEDMDKVVVDVDTYDEKESNPEGHIIEVLGQTGSAGVDITSIARKFELPYEFSEETLREADALPEEVDPEDMKGRRDLRKKFTVTIDGADAKDFDDAISVERHGKFYNLYVHIADVSHYVKEGSAIDRDAYQRGNSVYLLDRVIPMLPEKLSNGLCSLNPNVDRLTMTTRMTLDQAGTVLDYECYPSVICSDHRLVYDDVSDYIERGHCFSEDDDLYPNLDLMTEIYKILAERRAKRGTIDFDFPESQVRLDEEGKPVFVGLEERRIANRIIEEFMVLNNTVVGRHFFRKKLPFVYRVHDEPSEEKMERLNRALAAFRYPIFHGIPEPKELRTLLDSAKGKKEEGILNMLMLQSMQKALYTTRPGMHYGLATDHYSHFTSPIRRYSDLLAHRLMKALLEGHPEEGDSVKGKLEEKCSHISDTERKAEDAERDVVDMKCAEYMQDHVGETFEGIVSSLVNFGVFIMLDNTIEGLAHFRDMTDDYYTYDEEHFVVRGERSHRELHYGDRVEVLVTKANPLLREIDFQIQWPSRHPLREGSARKRKASSFPGSHKGNRRRSERPLYPHGAKRSQSFSDRGEEDDLSGKSGRGDAGRKGKSRMGGRPRHPFMKRNSRKKRNRNS